jgi:hypothetical protein
VRPSLPDSQQRREQPPLNPLERHPVRLLLKPPLLHPQQVRVLHLEQPSFLHSLQPMLKPPLRRPQQPPQQRPLLRPQQPTEQQQLRPSFPQPQQRPLSGQVLQQIAEPDDDGDTNWQWARPACSSQPMEVGLFRGHSCEEFSGNPAKSIPSLT